MRLILTSVLPVLLLLTACGGGQASPATVSATAPPTTSEVGSISVETVAPANLEAPSPLAASVVRLPSAGGVPEQRSVRTPVSISFDAIGVSDVSIDPVGVLANGEMEIPGAQRVGWYSFGPSPGQAGSAVLAAHIAFDGERGAFRYLADSVAGDRFTVTFDDGETASFEVVQRAQYDKDELPFDRVFSRTGKAVITLISCGGEFQPSQSSYEDNIVAYAVPVPG